MFFTEGTVGIGNTHIYNARGNNKRVSASARTDTATDLLAGWRIFNSTFMLPSRLSDSSVSEIMPNTGYIINMKLMYIY